MGDKAVVGRLKLAAANVAAADSELPAQPRNAQANLYFPHLADGGAPGGQWQTRFTFINPNSSPASVTVSTFADGGGLLTLDFGGGPTSAVAFTIAANGTYVLASRMASSVTVTGWAYATSSLPSQGNVAFRLIQNGAAKVEITAEPTLPSVGYRSVATPLVGLAVANVYNSISLPVTVKVYDAWDDGEAGSRIVSFVHSPF